MEKNYDDTDVQITIELDDGKIMDCDVLLRFPVPADGEQQYIALSPCEEENVDTIYLYRFDVGSDGEPILTNIETDEEYEAVADRFDEILDEIEFSEIDD